MKNICFLLFWSQTKNKNEGDIGGLSVRKNCRSMTNTALYSKAREMSAFPYIFELVAIESIFSDILLGIDLLLILIMLMM